jgi:hypothetical protein
MATLRAVFVVGVILATGLPAHGQAIWWGGDQSGPKIWRRDINGMSNTTILTNLNTEITDIQVDPVNLEVYWTESNDHRIMRSDVDGESAGVFISLPVGQRPFGLALDIAGNKLYWTNDSIGIQRATLSDGSSIETIVGSGFVEPRDIELDLSAGHIYWSDEVLAGINRADLDGANVVTIQTAAATRGISLDLVNGWIYYANRTSSALSRVDLAGTTVEDLVTGITNISGVAVDIEHGKVYWTDHSDYVIERVNLDGTARELFVETNPHPWGIAYEPIDVHYVNDDAIGANDGSSWDDAYNDLQDALDAAVSGDQIWVATGTYKPDRGTGDQTASFVLKDQVDLYGGFDGTEADLADRAELYAETVLSGNISTSFSFDNSHHVLWANSVSATVDGLAIRDGSANGSYPHGGGLRASNFANVTIRNCMLEDNTAGTFGGGILVENSSSVNIHNTIIRRNTAGNQGGGIYVSSATTVALQNSEITDNTSTNSGGGISNNGSVTLVNCAVTRNTRASGNSNGGIYSSGSVFVINTIVWSNGSGGPGDQLEGGAQVVVFSNIQHWPTPGIDGNIDSDPLFVDPLGPDGIGGTADDDLRLLGGSPCIDAGDNELATDPDLGGTARIVDGNGDMIAVVDMGPYEYQGPPDCNINSVDDAVDISGGTSDDCNSNAVPDECDIDQNTNAPGGPFYCTSQCDPDCNDNGVPDSCDIDASVSEDCNWNDIPDECDLESGFSQDCNTNLAPDACDVVYGTSEDCQGNDIPDECEDVALWLGADGGSFIDPANWTTGEVPDGYAQISNMAAADNAAILVAGQVTLCELAINATGAGNQVLRLEDAATLVLSELTVGDGGLLDLKGGSVSGSMTLGGAGIIGYGTLTGAAENSSTITGSSLGDLVISGDSFTNAVGATVSAPFGAFVNVQSASVTQQGTLEVGGFAGMLFTTALINEPNAAILLGGGSLGAPSVSNQAGADLIGFGLMDTSILNTGQMLVTADTEITGDLSNDGIVTIQNGLLTVIGALSGSGTIFGDFGPGPGMQGLTVLGDSAYDPGSDLLLTNGLLRVGGDLDIAIANSSGFGMATSMIQFIGPGGMTQSVEVLAEDAGNAITLPRPDLFSVETLRIGPTPTTVQLVDNHDNTTGGGAEALYVDQLLLEPGTTRDITQSCGFER